MLFTYSFKLLNLSILLIKLFFLVLNSVLELPELSLHHRNLELKQEMPRTTSPLTKYYFKGSSCYPPSKTRIMDRSTLNTNALTKFLNKSRWPFVLESLGSQLNDKQCSNIFKANPRTTKDWKMENRFFTSKTVFRL